MKLWKRVTVVKFRVNNEVVVALAVYLNQGMDR